MGTMTSLWMTILLSGMTSGHVFLYDPPQRSSIWRHEGMDKTGLAERNNDDMGLNCGGMATEYEKYGGKCGVCGDPYDPQPVPHYPHQYPGRFARGVIAGCYKAGARTMEAEVWVTAHHKGYFEFRLCPNNDYTRPVTQSCLDKHVLQVESSQGEITGTRYYPDEEVKDGIYKVKLVLPPGLVCTQCVLQFLYNAGNSWGCKGKQCGIGYGNQEQFWNCADIAILPNCQGVVGNQAPMNRPLPNPKQKDHGNLHHNHNTRRNNDDSQNLIHNNHVNQIHGNLVQGLQPHILGHPKGATLLFSHFLQDRENELGRQRETERESSDITSDGDDKDGTEQGHSEDTTQIVLDMSRNQNHVVLGQSSSNRRSGTPSRSHSEGHVGSINNGPHPSRTALRGSIKTATSHSGNRGSSSEHEANAGDGSTCRAAGAWKGDNSMDDWCRVNCGQGYCPSSNCACDD